MHEFTFPFKKGASCYLQVEPRETDKTLEISEKLNTADYVVPINAYWIMMEFKRIVGCVFCSQNSFLLV